MPGTVVHSHVFLAAGYGLPFASEFVCLSHRVIANHDAVLSFGALAALYMLAGYGCRLFVGQGWLLYVQKFA